MPTTEAVLAEIEAAAKSEHLPIVGRDQLRLILQLIEERRPCRVVEVGVMVGYLTVAAASRLGAGCRLTGVEISRELAQRAEENLVRAGLSDRVGIVRSDARLALDEIEGPIDFLILDAERNQLLNYLKKVEIRLAPGAVVCALGVGNPVGPIAAYLRHVRESGRYETQNHQFGQEAVEISTYKG
ncbi:hypothetical protein A3C96_02515 [Candidatus Uhrbacteria bacterium RIFCSPHIGHO2_02_FULL_60_10]|uniref:Methyltransferase domain-containing protein n=1 Tax=Candidatus Uhrbacteria bacterium RIFCSPHIGHO2_02_FULL_60_10 TaxID=1802392 RepID=A0A1F7U3R2_9BACT|nr:MAG: hypothetical protein A3C96_02515 [Candidatus Uhrbacteria bacterium RIFCSPHIGHO2_02_FULL_60_10]